MKLKQWMVGALLLVVAGCGCNDDTTAGDQPQAKREAVSEAQYVQL